MYKAIPGHILTLKTWRSQRLALHKTFNKSGQVSKKDSLFLCTPPTTQKYWILMLLVCSQLKQRQKWTSNHFRGRREREGGRNEETGLQQSSRSELTDKQMSGGSWDRCVHRLRNFKNKSIIIDTIVGHPKCYHHPFSPASILSHFFWAPRNSPFIMFYWRWTDSRTYYLLTPSHTAICFALAFA